MQDRQYSTILDATSFALGSGIGWFIAIVSLAAIREKIRYSNVPPALRGLGITFIVTGLMGIAFMSFMGVEYGKRKKKRVQQILSVEVLLKPLKLLTKTRTVMGLSILITVVFFLAVILLLVSMLLFVKAKLSPAGK